jgi:hypothetical protein
MAEKKPVKVTIFMDALLDDIIDETNLRGRTLQNDTNYKEVASLFASLDEENKYKILRSIKKAFSEVKLELSEYIAEGVLTTDNSNIDESTDLVLALSMPSNFNEAATAALSEAAHDYIRNVTVRDWYEVTNKGDAADYEALAAKSLENVRKSVSKRSRPARRATSTATES